MTSHSFNRHLVFTCPGISAGMREEVRVSTLDLLGGEALVRVSAEYALRRGQRDPVWDLLERDAIGKSWRRRIAKSLGRRRIGTGLDGSDANWEGLTLRILKA